MPRIDGNDMKRKIKDLIYKHSEKIIDRLYSLFRTGSVSGYKDDPNAFDPQIYRSANLYNDLDRLRTLFDGEGVQLENDIGGSFEADPSKVKQAALEELLIEKNSNDLTIVEEKKGDKMRQQLAILTDFNLVYGFILDVKRGIMSYDYIRSRLDSELQYEDEEDKRLEFHIEGEEDTELEPAQSEARKLIHVLKNRQKMKKTIN